MWSDPQGLGGGLRHFNTLSRVAGTVLQHCGIFCTQAELSDIGLQRQASRIISWLPRFPSGFQLPDPLRHRKPDISLFYTRGPATLFPPLPTMMVNIPLNCEPALNSSFLNLLHQAFCQERLVKQLGHLKLSRGQPCDHNMCFRSVFLKEQWSFYNQTTSLPQYWPPLIRISLYPVNFRVGKPNNPRAKTNQPTNNNPAQMVISSGQAGQACVGKPTAIRIKCVKRTIFFPQNDQDGFSTVEPWRVVESSGTVRNCETHVPLLEVVDPSFQLSVQGL